MCGIAGYYGSTAVQEERVQACLELMRRRGPDASGFVQKALTGQTNLTLLHSRLSIIDLDPRANQPMRRDGRLLVFNGEIYNYRELRDELTAQGDAFHTTSDTEVLLAALNRWGLAALDRMEGMWAFASLDETNGELLLCRDRFAEKPLCLYRDETGLYFGSEVKFLAALSGKRFKPNDRHIARYIVNGYKSLYKTSETFFEGVSELPHAAFLRLTTDGRSEQGSYFKPYLAPEDSMTYAEAVEGAKNALIRSMELRLRADVPLAFCMSGGVDSNSLISIAKRVFGYDVHGFTIVNQDERYNESELVNRSAAELGIRHTAIPVRTTGFLEGLAELVRHHDAPVYTITYYAHWLLQKSIAEQGYKISISGTGADELFTGYYDHHSMYLAHMHMLGHGYAEALENWQRHIKPIVRNPLLQDPESFVKNPGHRDHIYLDAEQFAACLTRPFTEPFSEETYVGELLRNRMMNELFNEGVPVILHEDDLNAMYYSIENRSPFLDRGLFDFCVTIPTRHLIGDGFNKKVLRDSMRGIVPDAILDSRRKVGFNAPIFSFLDVHDPAVRRMVLADSPVFEHIRRESIQAVMDKEHLPNSESKFLFNFLNAKLFYETFG